MYIYGDGLNFADILSKLYPKSFKEKTRVDYDFDLDEDKYSIVLRNTLQRSWWLQLIRQFNVTQSSQNKIQLLDEFEVTNDRLKSQMKNHLRGTIEKVANDVRKDEPMKNLKLLTANVDSVKYKQVDAQTVKSEIVLTGICSV